MKFPLMRSCREAAAMLVAREDLALSRADRIALRMHLIICDTCPRFEKQMLTMRNGLRQWRNYTGPEGSNGAEHTAK